MDDDQFARLIRELRGEFTAPGEVAAVCAVLIEALRRENQELRDRLRALEKA